MSGCGVCSQGEFISMAIATINKKWEFIIPKEIRDKCDWIKPGKTIGIDVLDDGTFVLVNTENPPQENPT